MVVHLRKDGSAERVEAEGDVTLTNGAGGRVTAPRGEMMLNAQNQAQSAVMIGGVKYDADDPLRKAQGEASEARATFDKKGHPEHVTITGAVHLKEQVRASDAVEEPWSERELNAGAIDLALTTDAAGQTLLRDAKAVGDARLQVLSATAKAGTTNSSMAADVLTAHFVRGRQCGSYCRGAWERAYRAAKSECKGGGEYQLWGYAGRAFSACDGRCRAWAGWG